jgi:hypothetical protein
VNLAGPPTRWPGCPRCQGLRRLAFRGRVSQPWVSPAPLVGPNAAEIINLFAIAIRLRIPAFDLKQVPFAYPTYGSDIRFMI